MPSFLSNNHVDAETVGERLLPQVVDRSAETQPDLSFCIIPRSPVSTSQGWRNVSYQDLSRAVNYMSWWIEEKMGEDGAGNTIAYMGLNDLRYFIISLAGLKTGHEILFPSPRIADEAQLYLLKVTNCKHFVYSAEHQRKPETLKKTKQNLILWEIPSLEFILEQAAKPYPYTKSYAEAEHDPYIIIHSSGTTGMPKPVHLRNGYFAVVDNLSHLEAPKGRKIAFWTKHQSGELHLSMSPFFHLMGFATFVYGVFNNARSVYAPDTQITVPLLTEIVATTKPTCATIVPSLLEDMSHSAEGLKLIKGFQTIYYGGAPLAPSIGKRLYAMTQLVSVFGSTETGLVPSLIVGNDDWDYFEWHPAAGLEMRPVGSELYELVVPKSANRKHTGIFQSFPDLEEYRTHDGFMKHPTKPGLWRSEGRLDDVIVLSNGEKFNSTNAEKIIDGHPLVSASLIIGEKRFQAALLVQPDWNQWSEDQDPRTLIDAIWPTVEKANAILPGHGKVFKSRIGLAKKNKPFKTTPKRTLQRRPIVQDYEEEINVLYDAAGDEMQWGHLPAGADLTGIKSYLKHIISNLLPDSDAALSDGSDIFSLGIDSLQTLVLSRGLQREVQFQVPEKEFVISTQTLYSHPTIGQLAQFVHSVITSNPSENIVEDEASRATRLHGLVDKYTKTLPEQSLSLPPKPATHQAILTGSTGSLGNYILQLLLSDSYISKVYCLNRSADAQSRQQKSFEQKGIDLDLHNKDRVEFLQASFGDEMFGLEAQKYKEMTKSVDIIIHNAWQVNFNHKSESFEYPHIQGVRRFVDFSLESKYRPHIYFVSSISSIGAWKPEHGPVIPEVLHEDPDVAYRMGYGESKWTSEQICAIASKKSGVPTSILRVGQIAGPTAEKGLWNPHEWLPAIISTSKSLGKIPSSLGTMGNENIDWIPVDTLAKIIVDIVHSRQDTSSQSTAAFFHLANPKISPWASLVQEVRKHFPAEPVDLSTWVHALEEVRNPTPEDFETKPALKILSFYQGALNGAKESGVPMSVERTKEASRTMREIKPIDGELMENWLKQWGGVTGLMTACRLAKADPNLDIVVLEKGPSTKDNPLVKNPAFYLKNLLPDSKLTTFYKSAASPNVAGRNIVVPMGHCLGGGGSINFMVYARPQMIDFDDWKTEGWGSGDMLPFLKRASITGISCNIPGIDKSVHGYSGEMSVSSGTYAQEVFQNDFIKSCDSIGIKSVPDPQNLYEANGVGKWNMWIDNRDGERSDVPHRILFPLLETKNTKLKIITDTTVVRILFDKNKQATGVEYSPNVGGNPQVIKAGKFVILAGGAISTPTVLERSGYGQKAILEKFGIPPVHYNEAVGTNYQDHNVFFYPYKSTAKPEETLDGLLSGRLTVEEAFEQKKANPVRNILGWNGLDCFGKIRPSAEDVKRMGPEFEKRWNRDFKERPTRPAMMLSSIAGFAGDYSAIPVGQYFSLGPYTPYPYSRGHAHIASTSAFDPPDFNCGFFQDPIDITKLVWGYKVQREIARRMNHYLGPLEVGHPKFAPDSKAASSYTDQHPEIKRIEYSENDDEAISQFLRENIGTAWHSLGTCAMKPETEGGVVDKDLNVHGVKGLKIVDLSICPSNVACNTYSVALAVGEKASSLLARDLGIPYTV
ncbi:MAG: putative NRPS-like protein biosynthetic cluster [Cirrosporium novae-zelandiae]|nr:MAG: putative NRPS-like protein biosynthetic cluster [Cirrosporium novae-zelandiae]